MYQYSMFLQTSTNIGQIYQGLLKTATSAQYDRMVVAVAYATKKACELIDERFQSEIANWKEIKKEWLISIDFGLTEPGALVYLANLPNSTVWVANAEAAINANLHPQSRFHNKMYIFESEHNSDVLGLLSGSANLTISGLYFNDEQATASIWVPPLNDSDQLLIDQVRQQVEFIDRYFDSGMQLDKDLLDQYRSLWQPKKISNYETDAVKRTIIAPTSLLPQSKAIALASASSFWVEVSYVVANRGPGIPGNQIDLQRGSRVFFGFGTDEVDRNTLLGTVRIRFDGEIFECNMRLGNNHMDKLNLPPLQKPHTYENQTMLFRRNADGIFDLIIGSPRQITQWKNRSRQEETLFRLRSGREYGVFTGKLI